MQIGLINETKCSFTDSSGVKGAIKKGMPSKRLLT